MTRVPHRLFVLSAVQVGLVWVLLDPAASAWAQTETPLADDPVATAPVRVRRWSLAAYGGVNLRLPIDLALARRSEGLPSVALLVPGSNPPFVEVELGYELRPGFLLVGSLGSEGLSFGVDNSLVPIVPTAPPYVPIASGRVIGYAAELRIAADSAHYFSDAAEAGAWRVGGGVGFGQQRGVGWSVSPAGAADFGVTGVEGAARNYVRLTAGFQRRLGQSHWAVDGLCVLMIGVSGHLATVKTDASSAFEPGPFTSNAFKYMLGVSYRF